MKTAGMRNFLNDLHHLLEHVTVLGNIFARDNLAQCDRL